MKDDKLVESIDEALHEICQPLTVLQCRLALGGLTDKPEAMHAAIREALAECGRMNETIDRMRTMLQTVIEQRGLVNDEQGTGFDVGYGDGTAGGGDTDRGAGERGRRAEGKT